MGRAVWSLAPRHLLHTVKAGAPRGLLSSSTGAIPADLSPTSTGPAGVAALRSATASTRSSSPGAATTVTWPASSCERTPSASAAPVGLVLTRNFRFESRLDRVDRWDHGNRGRGQGACVSFSSRY